MSHSFDVLIVGSGAAGLTAALNLAETRKVGVIAKGALGEGASGLAQGGIAAVLEEGDSFEAHVKDTMVAGAGLNDRAVVEHVVSAAPRAIERLIELGVAFAEEGGALHLTREGGHSHRRIVHVADATGWAVQQALEGAAARHKNIILVPDMAAIGAMLLTMPALLTRTSGGPSTDVHVPTAATTASASETSTAIETARRPSSSTAAAVATVSSAPETRRRSR